jgi:hypothetical protein
MSSILHPLQPVPASLEVIAGLSNGFTILSVDVILLCRMFAVFPPSVTSKLKLALVFTLPLLFKASRLALLIAYAVQCMPDFRLHPQWIVSQDHDTSATQIRIYQSIWFITLLDHASVGF